MDPINGVGGWQAKCSIIVPGFTCALIHIPLFPSEICQEINDILGTGVIVLDLSFLIF